MNSELDDECRIRQTSSNCTIDIYIASKPADEFDACLDRFLQNENSREREIKVVEMIGKQEYLDQLKPYETASWGDTFIGSGIHYHAPDEHTESDEEKNVLNATLSLVVMLHLLLLPMLAMDLMVGM